MNFKEWLTIQEYNEPRDGMKSRWSVKYKKSINCNNPKSTGDLSKEEKEQVRASLKR